MDMILERLGSYMETLSLRSFNIRWQDIVEVIIISFLLYQIMAWVKHTKVWLLMKGIVIIMAFILFAIAFKMHTIIWIVEHVLSIAVTAMIVILQPELRHALEELGRKSFVTNLITFEKPTDERFSDKTVNDLVKASFEMGKVKTGALMVIEQNVLLTEYERTGIELRPGCGGCSCTLACGFERGGNRCSGLGGHYSLLSGLGVQHRFS